MANDSGKEKKEFESVDEFLKEKFKPKDILQLNDRQLEALYAQAYNLYQTGRFNDALQIFHMLTTIEANQAKYVLGLAACHHMMKNYQSAIDTYLVQSILEPENPIPFYHMSDCYLAMKDPYSALMVLDMTVKKAGNKPEFKTLKDRATLTMENLRKEIKEEIKT
ncbi:MAG: SycD/LcrH family type III secretion system chaperone [Parachlamydiaceae bacterium]|nr:MAG: SycD/LcrH family type III secretion system chaperone [Parachlamydiaceae bacterium]